SGPGGGMAEAGGVLYVTTGFGEVMALNPATGGEYWRVTLDAPIRAAPTVADGRVYVVARNDSAYAFSASDGAILWRVQGAGGPGVLGGASPAVDGALVAAPFISGEVLGLLARNGLQIWGTAVTGGRRELVRNRISDITGDPVIDGAVVYASNQSGRTISLDRATGERNWTIPEGAFGPAWPVGGSVFLLSDLGSLVRVDAETGGLIWSTQLPEYFNARRREAIAHHGPLLAGGRLWVASSDGLLRAFSPNDGALVGTVPLPGGAAAPPALARGVMYVVTRDGRLHAFQ
ncbi:MAG: PQQ-binding-like beta-propeller repeat protein, partial [Rhodobacteraceae bacterium]|nr:PQQ-binding-like beta-propeller repeat protein [Paracoccaceae bacterium]